MGKIDRANRDFRRMHAEACGGYGGESAGVMGIYRLTLTAREDMFELTLRAAAGDWLAFACCRAAANVLAADCLLCGRAAWPPAVVGLLHAERDDPKAATAVAICDACRATHPTVDVLQTAITEFFRDNLAPTLRVLLAGAGKTGGALLNEERRELHTRRPRPIRS